MINDILLFSTYALQPSRLIVRSGLDVPTFVTRRLHACHHARAHNGKRRTVGEKCPEILPKCRFPRYILGSFTCRKAMTWDRRLLLRIFLPQKSDGFGRVRTRELRYQRPARYLLTTEAASTCVQWMCRAKKKK
jgi:hypothetical protein